MVNDFSSFSSFDRFDKRGGLCAGQGFPQLLTLLIRNVREAGPRAGLPLTGERAGSKLEGGLRSFSEGLRDSRCPCARLLSVAGFLALLKPFLSKRGFILRVRKGSFWPGRPLFFNLTGITVVLRVQEACIRPVHGVQGGYVQGSREGCTPT